MTRLLRVAPFLIPQFLIGRIAATNAAQAAVATFTISGVGAQGCGVGALSQCDGVGRTLTRDRALLPSVGAWLYPQSVASRGACAAAPVPEPRAAIVLLGGLAVVVRRWRARMRSHRQGDTHHGPV